METKSEPQPPLRALLSEAAEHRRRGDLAAASMVENDALRVIRASIASARAEAQA